MKKTAIAAGIASIGVITTLAITNTNNPPKGVQKVSEQTTTAQPATTNDANTETPATEATPVPTPAPTPISAPAPVPKPDYGESATKGLFVVFDKTAILTKAGISSGDQSAAASVISNINAEWHYNKDNLDGYNICSITPNAKMASAGADYLTNPITQLKWCAQYIQARYGTWNAALTHAQTDHSI